MADPRDRRLLASSRHVETGNMTGGKPNRLIREKSPYLLQHARNPVDWHPWGGEAFARAKEEDRPVFLSIGYSTCHWCHVMARESFEDPRVAALMNESFVNIKVDREERPDIDQVYMAAALALTGSGGWPLTIIMTPDKKPFFAATYIPPGGVPGQTGLVELIPRIIHVWRERRGEVIAAAEGMAALLEPGPSGPGLRTAEEALARAAGELRYRFDREHGGFGTAPKFPAPHTLVFLLRAYRRSGDPGALAMAEQTLRAMRNGGIYDHLGSGFHRYATDASWRVPHFEKMLYDQALLAQAYTEAYQVTGTALYRETAEGVLGYLLRDLRGGEGAFRAAEDAESGGVEGGFYLWTMEEVQGVLDGKELDAFVRYFGILPEGNFTPTGESPVLGQNVLSRAVAEDEVAGAMGISPGEVRELIRAATGKMREARERRPRPARDGKVLTDWNGLAIAAFALGGRVFRSDEYLAVARTAADFILATLVSPDGRVLHRYTDGDAAIPGNADDYVFLAWGLTGLYRSTHEIQYLERAVALTDALLAHFRDEKEGGFFFTPDDGEALIARQKPVHDGAIPSANSLALALLFRLSGLTGRSEYLRAARELSAWFLAEHAGLPAASTGMMISLDLSLGPTVEVVLAGDPAAADTREILGVLDSRDDPGMTVLLRRPGGDPLLDELAPFTTDFEAREGKATAYLCRDHACELPVTDPEALRGLLDRALRGPFPKGR
jgi:uncharacterized protein YyaL (SSP411 family)